MTNQVRGQQYRFTILTERLLRMEYSADGQFEDRTTQMVQNREFTEVPYQVLTAHNHFEVEIITNYYHLYYKGGPFAADTLYIDVNYRYSDYHNRWHFGESVENLGGTVRTLDKADGVIPLAPGIMAYNGFAAIDDSASFILEQDHFKPRDDGTTDWYYFAYGHDFQKALQDYYRLTGPTPLLPRYALGNWWSRYWAYSERSLTELLHHFDRDGLPFSVVTLDMDGHLTDIPKRFGSGWTGYTWNQALFSDPAHFLAALHARGLKVTLNVHPAAGIRAYEAVYPVIAQKLGLDQSNEEPALFDLNQVAFRATYFQDVHQPLEEMGVDFWWLDWQQGGNLGARDVDPLWLLNHYHYQDSADKHHGEGLILSRYAGPGSHRYPIGFSGDTYISWAALAFQPYFTATAANIGYTWWSHDIGGHMGGIRDDELALRWLQLGVFSPIMRLHSANNPFNGKEPWRYKNFAATNMVRFLRLRHELLPYLDSANYQTHAAGVPLVKPMYYTYDQPLAFKNQHQYLFGTELLVAPVVTPKLRHLDQSQVRVWLPKGMWFDFFNGLKYGGDTTLSVFRDETRIPVFAKAGAIVPLNPNYMADINQLPEVLKVLIFPGASNEYVLYEHLDGQVARTHFIFDWLNKELTIRVVDPGQIIPEKRHFQCQFRGVNDFEPAIKSGSGNVTPIELVENDKAFIYSCAEARQSQVTFSLHRLRIMPQRRLVVDRLFNKLNQAQIEYDLKNEIWTQFLRAPDKIRFINFLNTLADHDLAKMLYELVYIL